jgi:hypothetical protein
MESIKILGITSIKFSDNLKVFNKVVQVQPYSLSFYICIAYLFLDKVSKLKKTDQGKKFISNLKIVIDQASNSTPSPSLKSYIEYLKTMINFLETSETDIDLALVLNEQQTAFLQLVHAFKEIFFLCSESYVRLEDPVSCVSNKDMIEKFSKVLQISIFIYYNNTEKYIFHCEGSSIFISLYEDNGNFSILVPECTIRIEDFLNMHESPSENSITSLLDCMLKLSKKKKSIENIGNLVDCLNSIQQTSSIILPTGLQNIIQFCHNSHSSNKYFMLECTHHYCLDCILHQLNSIDKKILCHCGVTTLIQDHKKLIKKSKIKIPMNIPLSPIQTPRSNKEILESIKKYQIDQQEFKKKELSTEKIEKKLGEMNSNFNSISLDMNQKNRDYFIKSLPPDSFNNQVINIAEEQKLSSSQRGLHMNDSKFYCLKCKSEFSKKEHILGKCRRECKVCLRCKVKNPEECLKCEEKHIKSAIKDLKLIAKCDLKFYNKYENFVCMGCKNLKGLKLLSNVCVHCSLCKECGFKKTECPYCKSDIPSKLYMCIACERDIEKQSDLRVYQDCGHEIHKVCKKTEKEVCKFCIAIKESLQNLENN